MLLSSTLHRFQPRPDRTDKKVGHYEEDHLISLELGGDEASEKNLWPEPYTNKWGARTKDTLEFELGGRICLPAADSEYLSLKQAWVAVTVTGSRRTSNTYAAESRN